MKSANLVSLSRGNGDSAVETSENLVRLLHYRAKHQGDRVAYILLESGETESARITYAQLAQRAHAIAAHLQQISAPGMRALLLCPSGVHFMPMFFGCLCAGVVAVPCYPPKRNRIDSRLDAIAADAGASLVLTTSQIISEIDSRLSHSPELATLRWVATDTLGDEDASRYREPLLCSETLGLASIYLRLHRKSEGSDAKPRQPPA